MVVRSGVRYIHIATAPGNNQPVSLANIAIAAPGAPTVSLPALQTLQLTATATDFFGHALSTSGLTWSSSNPAAATVNSSTGLVTGVAIGVTTITASLSGIVATLVINVAQAKDGSFADLQSVITDLRMPSAWEFPSGIVALDGGGFVSSVPDIRGGTSRLPLTAFALFGNKPSYNAGLGRITTSGNSNYLQTAYSPGYNLGSTKTLVLISTSNPGVSNFTACVQGPGDSDPVLGLALDAGGKGILGAAGNGGIVPTGKGYAPQPGVIGLHIITGAPSLGAGTTLGYPLYAYERPGRTRLVQNINGALPATVNCAVTVGGWRNSIAIQGSADTFCGVYLLDKILTLAEVQAFQRRAVALGGTLA